MEQLLMDCTGPDPKHQKELKNLLFEYYHVCQLFIIDTFNNIQQISLIIIHLSSNIYVYIHYIIKLSI